MIWLKDRVCGSWRLGLVGGLLSVLLALLIAGLQAGAVGGKSPGYQLPPLYLSIVVHSEEDVSGGVDPKANIPDYDGNPAVMRHFALVMRSFTQMAAEHGARINFGSDWTFSRGVALHQPTFYEELEAMGHEIDAHAHESFIMYSQVRDEIAAAGGHPTSVASGIKEEAVQDKLAHFDSIYPEFTILWGVAMPGHGTGECTASWVWRLSRDDWTHHDPQGDYIYIGHGELLNSIRAIRQAADARRKDRANTYAVFVTPREFKAAGGTPGLDQRWTASTDSISYWENRLTW